MGDYQCSASRAWRPLICRKSRSAKMMMVGTSAGLQRCRPRFLSHLRHFFFLPSSFPNDPSRLQSRFFTGELGLCQFFTLDDRVYIWGGSSRGSESKPEHAARERDNEHALSGLTSWDRRGQGVELGVADGRSSGCGFQGNPESGHC